MIRIECSCKTCKTNATKVGASFPLKADIPEALAATIGKDVHGTVFIAHEPGRMGNALRARTGVVAVA